MTPTTDRNTGNKCDVAYSIFSYDHTLSLSPLPEIVHPMLQKFKFNNTCKKVNANNIFISVKNMFMVNKLQVLT